MTPAVQDYLKLIHHLQQQTDDLITTQAVADGLGIAPPPATRMLQKLAESGWVEYSRYQGARLTAEGERQALLVLRTHRIVEVYLVQSLGYTWDEVHEEADRLEHAVSPLLLDRLEASLGCPTHDPHGSPIPTRNGSLPDSPPVMALANLPNGTGGTVSRVNDEDPQLLRHLAEIGLVPGVTIRRMEEPSPWGMIPLDLNGNPVSIHSAIGPHIFIRVEPGTEASDSSASGSNGTQISASPAHQ